MSGYLLQKNRKALRNYELVEKYSAGISLKGYEVKALRERKADFEGSYIVVDKGVPYVVGLNIGRYSKQSFPSEEKGVRRRKLLLTKQEIEKIEKELAQKGRTAVPLALVLKNNIVKLEFAVVRGRKEYESKLVAKEKQIQKDLEKEAKKLGL